MRSASIIADTTAALGTNPSAPIILDSQGAGFNVGAACVPVNGTPTYKLQYCLDDPFSAAGLVTWFDSAVIVAIANAVKDDKLVSPVRAIRINITASAGAVKLTAVQASPGI